MNGFNHRLITDRKYKYNKYTLKTTIYYFFFHKKLVVEIISICSLTHLVSLNGLFLI